MDTITQVRDTWALLGRVSTFALWLFFFQSLVVFLFATPPPPSWNLPPSYNVLDVLRGADCATERPGPVRCASGASILFERLGRSGAMMITDGPSGIPGVDGFAAAPGWCGVSPRVAFALAAAAPEMRG